MLLWSVRVSKGEYDGDHRQQGFATKSTTA